MNKEQLAETLNGRYYGDEITKEEQQQAKENGLVVVFGASDDLMEFRGALYDEYSCYDGGSVLFTSGGQEVDEDDLEVLKKYEVDKSFNKIEAVWGEGYDTGDGDEPCSWQYKTDIPHSTFRVIEDNELYCVGIVFHISSLV